LKVHFFLFFFAGFFSSPVNAQPDSLRGLQTDIMLHPGDGFTAYTLKKNEFIYNQSPFTLPLPSWAWWGITDKITAEIDLLPLLGGFFQPPHLPVPSLNFRFRLYNQQKWIPTIAFETMFQHLWTTQNQADLATISIERDKGNSWYNRFNFSWYNQKRLHLHLSLGATYTENLRIENKDSLAPQGRFFSKTVNPDLSLSLDWRPKPWFSTHLTASYGTTFVYLDNIPRKYQVAYGFRFAPFYGLQCGFLRTFRLELTGLYMHFPDAKESLATYLPIFPYFYWQWTCKKKNASR
jgi:hypothetical protein